MFAISMSYVTVFDNRHNNDDDDTENCPFLGIVESNISTVLT